MSTTRWYVHKDSQAHGPYTASELRASLREGRFDPFDHVSREGSNVRVELVEVDEIFTDQKPDLRITAAMAMSEAAQPAAAASNAAPARTAQAPFQQQAANAPFVPKQQPQRQQQAPAQNRSSGRKDSKRFFLQDRKKRLLGPLSGREIEALYSRGRLDNAVKVFKNGGSKGIPVVQFVAAYAGAKYAELNEANNLDGMAVTKPAEGLPNSRVMEEFTRAVALRGIANNSTPWVTIAGLVVGIVAAYLVARQYVLPRIDQNSQKTWTQLEHRVTGEIETPASKHVPDHPGLVAKPIVPAPVEVNPSAVVITPAANATAPKAVKPAKAAPASRRKTTIYVAPQRSQPRYNPPAVAIAPRRVTPPPPAAKPKLAAPPATGGSIAQLAGKAGTVVTVGPLVYSTADLAKCGMKCTLVFRDQFGGKLNAVFFKGKHQDALTKKRGSAKIRGNLADQGGQLVIYLESVL